MDSKAQVSLEYLLTLLFAIILVVAASIMALNLQWIAYGAEDKIIEYRDAAISSLMG